MIDLVRSSGLVLESQAGRSVGYRQALEYLKTAWGFPHNQSAEHDARQEEKHVYVEQVRRTLHCAVLRSFLYYCGCRYHEISHMKHFSTSYTSISQNQGIRRVHFKLRALTTSQECIA